MISFFQQKAQRFGRFACLCTGFLLFGRFLQADIQNMYGQGVESLGSAAAVRTSSSDLLSNSMQPAALTDWRETSWAAQFLYVGDQFSDLTDIVVDSERFGGASRQVGNVDTDVTDIQNLLLGVVVPSKQKNSHKGLAVFANMPVGSFLSIETQSAYYPQYMLYHSDGQRLSSSAHFFDRWSETWDYSVGLHMYFATGSSLSSRFPGSSDSEPRSSSVDLKVEVKPAFAPSFSLRRRTAFSETLFSVIAERNAKMAFSADNAINVFVSPVPLRVDGMASLYYDPLHVQWAYHFKDRNLDWHFAMDYEAWSRFRSSVVIMEISGANSFEQLFVDQKFYDVVSFRAGLQWQLPAARLSFGYGYRPSPVRHDQENSNYLDSDRQIFGFSFQSLRPLSLEWLGREFRWGLGAQLQRLNRLQVSKQLSDSIGYPSYKIGGELYALSIQIQSDL